MRNATRTFRVALTMVIALGVAASACASDTQKRWRRPINGQ
jgi:hypothetical protein